MISVLLGCAWRAFKLFFFFVVGFIAFLSDPAEFLTIYLDVIRKLGKLILFLAPKKAFCSAVAFVSNYTVGAEL